VLCDIAPHKAGVFRRMRIADQCALQAAHRKWDGEGYLAGQRFAADTEDIKLAAILRRLAAIRGPVLSAADLAAVAYPKLSRADAFDAFWSAPRNKWPRGESHNSERAECFLRGFVRAVRESWKQIFDRYSKPND
jgi:hypothetical protein